MIGTSSLKTRVGCVIVMGTSSLKTRVSCAVIGGSSNRGIVADALTKLNIVGNLIVGHMLNPMLADFDAFKQPFTSPRQYSVLLSYLVPELSVLEPIFCVVSKLISGRANIAENASKELFPRKRVRHT